MNSTREAEHALASNRKNAVLVVSSSRARTPLTITDGDDMVLVVCKYI